MISKILTAVTTGLEVRLIEVEISLTQALPAVVMVGLPGKAVQESKERIRSALKESAFDFPLGKVTINLAPADIAKQGTAFDLAIAIGILNLTGVLTLEKSFLDQSLFLGELSLDGKLRSVNGILSVALWARKNRFKNLFIPIDNSREASLVSNLEILAVQSLKEMVEILKGSKTATKVQPINLKNLQNSLSNHWQERQNLLLQKFTIANLQKILKD